MALRIAYFSYGNNIIIDDIIYPDGHARMGILGGGSTYAAAGMRVWARGIGIVAGTGSDFPKAYRDHLERLDIDLTGLLVRAFPTPRAWQVLEPDGRRSETFQTDFSQFGHLLPTPIEVPQSYLNATGVHFFDFGDYSEVERLRSSFGNKILLWEPYLPPSSGATLDSMAAALPYVDIFAPGYDEAQRLCSTDGLLMITSQILDCGVAIAVIRMGGQGSVIRTRGMGGMVQLPSYSTEVVDPIGAGNAYCGGFLVGYCETRDILTAGLYGTVAASFMVEQVGLPPAITETTSREAEARQSWLRQHIDEWAQVRRK